MFCQADASSRKMQATELQRQLDQKIAENSRQSQEVLRNQLKLKQTNQVILYSLCCFSLQSSLFDLQNKKLPFLILIKSSKRVTY